MDPFSRAMNSEGDLFDDRMDEPDQFGRPTTGEERVEFSETRRPDGSRMRRAVRERIESMEPRPPVNVELVPCRAPPDEERLQERIRKQARDGFDPDATCTLCTIPDLAGKHIADNVERVYDYMNSSAATFPGRISSVLIAKRVNSEIVSADQATGGDLNLPQTTESEVEWHLFEETLHLPGNEIRMLTVLIEKSLQRLNYLEDSQLFVERVENGVPTGVRDANWKGHNVHSKEMAKLLRLVADRTKLVDAKRKQTTSGGAKRNTKTFESLYLAEEY